MWRLAHECRANELTRGSLMEIDHVRGLLIETISWSPRKLGYKQRNLLDLKITGENLIYIGPEIYVHSHSHMRDINRDSYGDIYRNSNWDFYGYNIGYRDTVKEFNEDSEIPMDNFMKTWRWPWIHAWR